MIALAHPVASPDPREQVEAFLDHLAVAGRSPATVTAYASDLAQLFAFLARPPPWSWADVDRADLIAYTARLRVRGVAVSTLARKLASTKSFFHYLLDTHFITTDPTARVDAPRLPAWTPRVLSTAQVAALLAQTTRRDTPASLRDTAMLAVLRGTGVRVSELVGLDLGDVDLGSGYLRVIRDRDRERQIPFDAATHLALTDYLDVGRPFLKPATGPPPDPTSALFLNRCGSRMTRQGWSLILTGHARRAGVAGVTPNALRHGFAVALLSTHAALADVQALMGHAQPSSTAKYEPWARRPR